MATVAKARRDRSAGIRDAIRASAARLFRERGFDGTGVRDIAADAEVNPAIVIRHFGSKEALFIETVDATATWLALLDGPIDDVGRRAVRSILHGSSTGALSVFGVVVRASSRPDIRDNLRRSMIDTFAAPMIDRIEATDSPLRAHLFAAQLIGLMSALVVYDDPVLLSADAEQIVDLYGGALQGILTEG
ncbi:TetR/AcrR family transcriptional regulator [Microbacteriaceae bacterium VKM Ac-2854]|nr:TetR/AcrR family transcriptional regulator [Microbacteriaceae bacterium VKM Ac-2854]